MEQPYTGPHTGPGIGALGGAAGGGLRSAMEFAEMIVDTVREGLLVLDFTFHIHAANESFYRMCGVTREETEGRLVFDLQDGRWDLPELRDLLDRILPERLAFDDFQIEVPRENGERCVLTLNARQLNYHQLILLAIEDVTERVVASEDLEMTIRARTRQVRQLASRLSIAEQEERRRVSRILHDDLQQILTASSIMLSTVAKQTTREAGDAVVMHTQQVFRQATDLIRSLVVELSPSILDMGTLADILEWIAEEKRTMFGLEVTVQGEAEMADPALRTILFHLTREVLFNVAKHAGTHEARLSIADTDDHVIVRVEDDGSGFDTAALEEGTGTGFGLASIQERLEIIGGRCHVESAPGHGTRVSLLLPRTLDAAA